MFPENFIESLKNVPGFEEGNFVEAHATAGLTAIRLNPAKCERIEDTGFAGLVEGGIPWCPDGYYLKERPSFITDPLLHAGAYYVQEPSSMFLHHVLKEIIPGGKAVTILDLSAAPGGKSTLISSFIQDSSLLVSNEVIKTRANILCENLSKWGKANVVVTNNDPRDFAGLTGFFDVIVVDAPCSGSGMFRKDHEAMKEWSPEHVALCAARQQRILRDIMPALKEGGFLIYSTCSYSVEENEAILDICLNEHGFIPRKIPVNPGWGIVESITESGGWGYRFYPGKVKGEGFFLTVLQKASAPASKHYRVAKPAKWELPSKAELEAIKTMMDDPGGFNYFKHSDEIHCFPLLLEMQLKGLAGQLYLKKAGIAIGKIKGHDLLPAHEWALCIHRNKDFPAYDLSLQDALNYLRKQDVKIDNTKPGWAVVQHKGNALGLIKALPNRINNYYPMNWRILNK